LRPGIVIQIRCNRDDIRNLASAAELTAPLLRNH